MAKGQSDSPSQSGPAGVEPAAVSIDPSVEAEIAQALDNALGSEPATTDSSSKPAPARSSPARAARRQRVAKSSTSEEDETDDQSLESPGAAMGGDRKAPRATATPPPADEGQEPEPEGDEAVSSRQEAGTAATLDPVLRHAAKRNGWEDEAIDALYEERPDLAIQTFQRLHQSYNDLSSRFAMLGQAPPPPPQPAVPPSRQQGATQRQPQNQQQAVDALINEVLGTSEDDLRATHGDDMVDQVIKPLIDRVVTPLQQMQTWMRNQQMAAMEQELNSTFKALGTQYPDLYGNGNGRITAEQDSLRAEVCNVADQIRAGAATHGVDMSVAEALERAHLLVNAPRQEELLRKQITDKVKKRSARITARPSQREGRSGEDEQGVEAAKQAYAERAAELGIEL